MKRKRESENEESEDEEESVAEVEEEIESEDEEEIESEHEEESESESEEEIESEHEDESESKIISYGLHADKLVKRVENLISVEHVNEKFSNITVKVGNEKFYCHKLILQLNSDYFAKMELKLKTHTLENIEPDVFREVRKFMYTGRVQMSLYNLESLFTAASPLRLGIDGLKEICIQFTNDLIHSKVNNALQYSRLLKKFTLKSELRLMIFKGASETVMKAILSEDNLEVKSEMEVCEMLMKWLQVQTEAGHEVHPDKLLPLIRWSGVSVDYVKSKLLENTTLTSDPASFSFLSKVISYLLSGVQFEGLQTFHRPATGLETCLMIIVPNNKSYRISLQHPNKNIELRAMPTIMSSGTTAGLLNNNVYITGVRNAKKTWTWNNMLSDWSKCADMLTGRQYHCAAVVNSMLYVLGGWVDTDETALSSVDCYDTKTNKWSSAGQLIHAVKHAACVTYKNSIFVFGGSDKNNKRVAHVQVYNPAQESCTLMVKPMPHACRHIRAVLWETSVILLGRFTCFIYNFETKTWQEREQFKTGVDYFALTLDNSTVYIAGGGTSKRDKDNKQIWTCTHEIKSVSVLDIIQDKPAVWKHLAKLIKSVAINAFVKIELPVS